MNEIANTNGTTQLSRVDELAREARSLRVAINANFWELARVLTEARELVPDGQWGEWLENNVAFSERKVQGLIATYKRFKEIPALQDVGQTKLLKLLPLPDDAVVDFIEENDVNELSTREIEERVKAARAEERAKVLAEQQRLMDENSRAYDQQVNARLAAERALKALQEQEPKMPDNVQEMLDEKQAAIDSQVEEIIRLRAANQDSISTRIAIERENRQLRQDAKMTAQAMDDLQAEADRANARVRELESTAARGDADRVPASYLTIDTLSAAVSTFLGACVQLPQMRRNFATMTQDEKQEYETLLDTVEDWVSRSRRAVEGTFVEMEATGDVR